RRTQANRNNRAKQKMPHAGGSKSIATLKDEQKRKDGRPLDDDSAKTIDMINEWISGERSTDQPPHSVAWEGDVYS
ncbi:hypothetical protein HAX54_001411, partial [Datura stramonium]|nr:hypothetical protein [Datura stramonium]